MPYVWEEPEVHLEHNGVKVYHVYKSDDMDQGARSYWFGTSASCSDNDMHDPAGEHGAFDVRELNVVGEFDDDDDIIRAAIDQGILTNKDEG